MIKRAVAVAVASGALAASGAAFATTASAAPFPNCFDSYSNVRVTAPPNEMGLMSYKIDVHSLPFASGADVYIQTPGSSTAKHGTVPYGYESHTFRPYTGIQAGSVYVSIYQGSYEVCAGSTSLSASAPAATTS